MGEGFSRRLVAFAAALALPGAAAQAQGCKIALFADLPVTMEGLRASVPVRINDHPTSFWLDSGAWFSIMSRAKAVELGLTIKPIPVNEFTMYGIGGRFEPEMAKVSSFGLLKGDLRNVDFLVGGSDTGNALIGANLLGFRDTEFDLAHGSVKLLDATNCQVGNLPYWASAGQAYFAVPLTNGLDDPQGFRLPVTINGVKINALLDTGADTSLMSRQAAQKAGIDLHGPAVAAFDGLSGFGRKHLKGWSVPVDDVGIGDEHVLKTRIDVIDGAIMDSANAPDMLLGADFVLAHHIYVSRRLNQIVFTYTGGKPFIASARAPQVAAASHSAPTEAAPPSVAIPTGMHVVDANEGKATEPRTSDEFARRASVRATQHAYTGAIADYTTAIRLAPDRPEFYRDRADAYLGAGQAALAEKDIDTALTLNPKDSSLLLVRAAARLEREDRAGALADVETAEKEISPASLQMLKVAGLYAKAGKPDRAAPLVGPVIAAHMSDSELGEMLNARCWFRGLANVELAPALQDCNRAIRGFGAKADFRDSRGLVRYRQGDWAGAITDYDTALKTDGKQAWTLFMRGAARIASGDATGGKADQEAARAIAPKIAERAARYGLP
jgi:predicted aspartyl protease/Tfp pilus assembly protein PilF